MLSIGLYINGKLIDIIDIVNTMIIKKGLTKYLIDNKYIVWHRREDGARKLSYKVLQKLIKLRQTKSKDRLVRYE
jgi:hypothetical protein